MAGNTGACDPLLDDARCIPSNKMSEWREERYENDTVRAEKITEQVLGQSCRVCRVFGSPWLASKAAVRDLKLSQPEFWTERRYEVRAGVGIERDSEAAQDGVLYSSQLVPPGTAFEWEILIDNADPAAEEPLVFLGLRQMLHGGIPLGGGRSRGLGRVQLHQVTGEVVTQDSLVDYLATGKGQPVVWTELESRIADCLNSLGQGR
jgi:CRISPR-associated RAMP protein (TIGR02581 family)